MLNPAMRVKGTTLQQFLLGAALLSALAWNLAHAGEIKGLQLEQRRHRHPRRTAAGPGQPNTPR